MEADLRRCLVELADSQLLRFSRYECEAIPVLRVRFRQFRPGFRTTYNYFTEMMGETMLCLVMDDGEVDLSFEFVDAPKEDSIEPAGDEYLQILVSDGRVETEFDVFDYIFSPSTPPRLFASRHGRLPAQIHTIAPPFNIDHEVSQRFHDFLFPVEWNHSPGPIPRDEALGPAGLHVPETTDAPFHVFSTTDRRTSEGLFALINSVIQNAGTPNQFIFHILVDSDKDYYDEILDTTFNREFRYEVIPFPDVPLYDEYIEFLERNIRIEGNPSACERLDSVMNFVRLYLPEIFPAVDVGLYLDIDMIAQADIADLFQVDVSSVVLGAVAAHAFERYHTGLRLQGHGFNAGTLLINFKQWRNCHIQETIGEIMTLHRKSRLFRGGTEPVLNVACYGRWLDLDAVWNVTGLGFQPDIDKEVLRRARILHWNGSHKPWLADGLYRHLWCPYQVGMDR